MAEFLPSSLFAFVWTKDEVEVNITAILTEQLHGQKRINYMARRTFFLRNQFGKSQTGKIRSFKPVQIANQKTGFASSKQLVGPAVSKRG